jgi:hypothetical protein
MNPNSFRARSLLIFLWVSVVAWGIALGGKLFELLVLIPAWAADPPTSFSLLPYGPRWPFDPGDFFQPLMLLILIGLVGALASGWNALRSYKVWLWVPIVAFLVTGVSTATIFHPMIGDLWGAVPTLVSHPILGNSGERPLAEAAAQSLANKWIVYDCGRAVLIAVGFFSVVKAISTKDRMNRT